MTNTADLRAAALAATPGPWGTVQLHLILGPKGNVLPAKVGTARYIALASPDRILGILRRVERLETALEGLLREAAPVYGGVTEDFWRAEREARAALEGKP